MATRNSIFAIATDIGGRDENQDRAFALSLSGRTLLVLADGMGGHRGGAMASQAIIEAAERLFRANPAQEPETLLPQIVRESCGVIAKENAARNLDGHSTCVLAFIDERACLTWLRIGDSRLFIFADKNHWWRSIDHTMLDLRVLKGELTDDESRRHPDRPFVFRSVYAAEPEMKVQRFGTLPAGTVLFLCSDGVWDAYPAKELYNVTRRGNVDSITKKIVKTAVARNGVHSDNCTALLYRAPFGDAKVNLSQLHLEELHALPQVTAFENEFRKKITIGIIAALSLIIIATAGYLAYSWFDNEDSNQIAPVSPDFQYQEQQPNYQEESMPNDDEHNQEEQDEREEREEQGKTKRTAGRKKLEPKKENSNIKKKENSTAKEKTPETKDESKEKKKTTGKENKEAEITDSKNKTEENAEPSKETQKTLKIPKTEQPQLKDSGKKEKPESEK